MTLRARRPRGSITRAEPPISARRSTIHSVGSSSGSTTHTGERPSASFAPTNAGNGPFGDQGLGKVFAGSVARSSASSASKAALAETDPDESLRDVVPSMRVGAKSVSMPESTDARSAVGDVSKSGDTRLGADAALSNATGL